MKYILKCFDNKEYNLSEVPQLFVVTFFPNLFGVAEHEMFMTAFNEAAKNILREGSVSILRPLAAK